MKFKYNSKLLLFFAVSFALVTETQAFAQDSDNVLAYRSSGKALAEGNDLDSEIFAAMQALDEVGALLDDRADAPKNSSVKNDDKLQKQNQTIPESHVDIDSLLAAANPPEQPKTKAVNAAPTPPKHDIQNPTAPKLSAILDAPAPKHDIQNPTAPKLSAILDAPAPKHDIQNPTAQRQNTTFKIRLRLSSPPNSTRQRQNTISRRQPKRAIRQRRTFHMSPRPRSQMPPSVRPHLRRSPISATSIKSTASI